MTKAEALIEGITQDIIVFIVEDKAIDYDDAMHIFYNSQIFEKLTAESTGLYLESPVYIYGLLKDELESGHIVQNEI